LVFPLLKYVFIVLWANDNGNGKIHWNALCFFYLFYILFI
jgi:hypothetical protein